MKLPPEDKTRCVKMIWPPGFSPSAFQCKRKRGYGPKWNHCKQHGKMADESQQQSASCVVMTPTGPKITK